MVRPKKVIPEDEIQARSEYHAMLENVLKKTGWPRKRLAEEISVAYSHISKYLSESEHITASAIRILETIILNVPLDDEFLLYLIEYRAKLVRREIGRITDAPERFNAYIYAKSQSSIYQRDKEKYPLLLAHSFAQLVDKLIREKPDGANIVIPDAEEALEFLAQLSLDLGVIEARVRTYQRAIGYFPQDFWDTKGVSSEALHQRLDAILSACIYARVQR